MAKQIQLKKPPVTEALLDIRVNLPKKTSLSELETFQKKIRKRFPNKRTKAKWESHVQIKKIKEGVIPKTLSSISPYGYQFLSPDKKKIVQARLDGFTFNKLKPYNGWGKFSKEAIELWGHYKQIASPLNITRIALRFINRIEIPLPFEDFKEYTLTTPEIAKDLPQSLSNFFMRLVIPDLKTKNVGIVIQTIEIPKKERKTLPLIFDIDVFRQITIKPTDKKLIKIIESLRNYKNEIFFNSLTDKALKLFN